MPPKIILRDGRALRHREFRDLQRHSRSYFKYWRAGKSRYWHKDMLQPLWSAYRVPRRGHWEGLESQISTAPPAGDLEDRVKLEPLGVAANEEGDDIQAGQNKVEPSTRALAAKLNPYRIRLNKILGWGGLGIAVLFDLEQDGVQPADWAKVVVKCDLNDPGPGEEYGVEEDRRWHNNLKYAKHLVQAYEFENAPLPDAGPAKRPRTRRNAKLQGAWPMINRREELNDDRSVLALEYLRRGNLARWIDKLNDLNERFYNRQYWLLADCLFKGIIGMAHPPILQPRPRGQKLGPGLIEEVLPPPHQFLVMSPDYVHFDIDATNILVGELGGCDGHDTVPTMKIGDFGVMEEMRDVKRLYNRKKYLWDLRRNGKTSYFTPEQFTQEWDYVRETPAANNRFKVAGRFSWKTNLYQFGMVLWSVVTGCKPPSPEAPPDAQVVDQIWDEARGDWRLIWSFGNSVNEDQYREIDPDFRDLIVNCLKERPDDRPEMRAIERLIRNKMAQEWPGHEDEAQWSADFWENPTPPGPKPQNDLDRFLAADIDLVRFQEGSTAAAGAGNAVDNENAGHQQQQGSGQAAPGQGLIDVLSDDNDEGGDSGPEYATDDDDDQQRA